MPAIREVKVDIDELLRGSPVTDETITTATAQLIVQCRNTLGEGIIYDDRSESVLWTDIMGCTLHKLQLNYEQPTTACASTYEMPRKVGSIGLLMNTTSTTTPPTTINVHHQLDSLPLLLAWEDGFQLYDIESERALSERSIGEDVNPAKGPTRLNDGRVDRTGQRFICGGYYGEQKETKMKVYRVEQREGKLYHEPIAEDFQVTNSISWSLDGTTMYLADSPTNQIHAYDYDSATGGISNKKLLHTKSDPEDGVPDGSCVDAEGFLWNAVWRSNGAGPGMVQRIDPSTGQVVFTVNMPDATSQITCCCFGGRDLDILFITTAAENRDAAAEPDAGGLYAVKLPFKGLPESRLNFTF